MAACGLAQQTTGAMIGTVTDTPDAVMAGVEVKLANIGTGMFQAQISSAPDGTCRFLLLSSGIHAAVPAGLDRPLS